VIFEAHGLPAGPFATFLSRSLLRRPELERIVFISRALQDLWQTEGLLSSSVRTLVAHDAADPFSEPAAEGAASSHPLAAGYVGHLYAGRGVELLIEVARRMPGVRFEFVGGRRRELERWRSRATPDNVVFHGFVPPAKLAAFYRRFDILLMPYQRSVAVRSGLSDTARWMSPMKMFEYMAAGKAIVSSDLPVLREVLEPDATALLVDPEDPAAWVQAIDRLKTDDRLRARLGEAAHRRFAAHHTWDSRARAVLADVQP
jgi:glycosyltransferase involved in cell wall biosynthesis